MDEQSLSFRLLAILVPIFGIVAAGYFYGRKHKPEMAVANRLNMDVFVPALVFAAMAGKSFDLTVYAPLPVMLAVLVGLAPQTRLYRSFFLDEIGQDYVRTARAKGLGERAVLMKHVLRNALIPILTNVSMQLPGIFVGSFLIEVFFSIPGIGREVMLAVNRSDYPVIQAVTIYLAVITMLINLLTDLLYKAVDPRVTLK